ITVTVVFVSGRPSATPQQAAPASARETIKGVERPGTLPFFTQNNTIAITMPLLYRNNAALAMATHQCQIPAAGRGAGIGTVTGLLVGICFTYSGRGSVEIESGLGCEAGSV